MSDQPSPDRPSPGAAPPLPGHLPSLAALADGIRKGNRAMLARGITLVESRKAEHQALARALVQEVLPLTGAAQRLGITGVPGVGKSTTIDTFGSNLTAAGHKVAVLAVDPSSTRTGGSILGDKTRMERLAVDPNAFIRPSPSAGTLGGVAAKTRESMLLCEAAGFDVILVETVGIGQSETAVADMVDFFLVLMLPGAGDELQGIKKGVLEVADMIAVNKADGEGVERARAAAADYLAALHILTPRAAEWSPPVLTISGLANEGLDQMWAQIRLHRDRLTASGAFQARRSEQQVAWMWELLKLRLTEALTATPERAERLKALEAAVRSGDTAPSGAVETMTQMIGL